MEIKDSGEFGRRLVTLAEVFDLKLSPQRVALYWEALRDLAFPAVARALNQAVQTCTFFPKPAELRVFALGSTDDHEERAWLTYRQLAREVGGYGSPTVADPALAEALIATFGSWEGACWADFSPEMWAAKRKEFGRVYRAMKERGQTEPKQLQGFLQRVNRLKGYDQPELPAGPTQALHEAATQALERLIKEKA